MIGRRSAPHRPQTHIFSCIDPRWTLDPRPFNPRSTTHRCQCGDLIRGAATPWVAAIPWAPVAWPWRSHGLWRSDGLWRSLGRQRFHSGGDPMGFQRTRRSNKRRPDEMCGSYWSLPGGVEAASEIGASRRQTEIGAGVGTACSEQAVPTFSLKHVLRHVSRCRSRSRPRCSHFRVLGRLWTIFWRAWPNSARLRPNLCDIGELGPAFGEISATFGKQLPRACSKWPNLGKP